MLLCDGFFEDAIRVFLQGTWDPLVLGPHLAIDRTRGRCASGWINLCIYICRYIQIRKESRVSDPQFFFADPDPDPGKNFHADPDPGGIRERGVKWKNDFFLVFFTFQMILNNGGLKSEQKKWNCLHCTSPTLQNNDLFIHFLTFLPGSRSANLCGSGQGKNMRILRIRIRNPGLIIH